MKVSQRGTVKNGVYTSGMMQMFGMKLSQRGTVRNVGLCRRHEGNVCDKGVPTWDSKGWDYAPRHERNGANRMCPNVGHIEKGEIFNPSVF